MQIKRKSFEMLPCPLKKSESAGGTVQVNVPKVGNMTIIMSLKTHDKTPHFFREVGSRYAEGMLSVKMSQKSY